MHLRFLLFATRGRGRHGGPVLISRFPTQERAAAEADELLAAAKAQRKIRVYEVRRCHELTEIAAEVVYRVAVDAAGNVQTWRAEGAGTTSAGRRANEEKAS